MVSRPDVVVLVGPGARPREGWLDALLAPYDDPAVGVVGARLCWPGCRSEPRGPVGMLLPNGTVSRDFDADPGGPVDADLVAAGALSFRRSALDAVGALDALGAGGGLPDGAGPAAIDAAVLRVRAAGWRVVHAPDAVVDVADAPPRPAAADELRLLRAAGRADLVTRYLATRARTGAWAARSGARRTVDRVRAVRP